MTIIENMGMTFEYGKQPDFGSIRMVFSRSSGKNEYILKSADVDKLNIIVEYNGASDGSTAYCTDTGDLYLLHLGVWAKVGAGSEIIYAPVTEV